MKTILLFLSVSVFGLLAARVEAASAPASPALLEGSAWTMRLDGVAGLLTKKDSLRFESGVLDSSACVPYGFKPGPYTQNGDEWTSHFSNDKGETMEWKGHVRGSVMKGSLIWKKANGKVKTYGWKATRIRTSTALLPQALPVDRQKLVTHLQNHVEYPADRQAVLAACANTDEFTAAQKDWVAKTLPEGNYASAEDVAKALGVGP